MVSGLEMSKLKPKRCEGKEHPWLCICLAWPWSLPAPAPDLGVSQPPLPAHLPGLLAKLNTSLGSML